MILEARGETARKLPSAVCVYGAGQHEGGKAKELEYGRRQRRVGWMVTVHGSRAYFTTACNQDQVMRGP